MMNLGDGLLFELENGKPRLVLAKYDAELKTSNKKGSCRIAPWKKTQKINSKQDPPQPDKTELERNSKHTPVTHTVRSVNVTHRPRMTNTKQWSDGTSSEAVRVQSESNRIDSCIVTQQKESIVCLTQEQFQQILSTINSRSAANGQRDPNTHPHTAEPEATSNENCPETTGVTEEFVLDGCNHKNSVKTERLCPSDEEQSGLFHTFGERERERDKLEARKAQWRRELDEQMALKRQQKVSLKEMKAQSDVKLNESVGLTLQTAAGIESSNHRALCQMQRELPAAIRSALVVGEAVPVEDMVNAQREEQQRLWLKELDQQRDEVKLRRQHDREISSKVNDFEQWTAHFDSLHQPSEQGVPDMSSCPSQQRSVSGALSTAWDRMSVCGVDSLGRASVDTTQGNQQRSSYLRTMTALLDPAQIEERERRRLKQLEHQQAIEAQVQERRCQKEKEEATRRTQEKEEEKRVEREREQLQQQYIKDTEQQRHREEVQSRKTEELYLSIQRAQEEASKVKHLQRIRDLAKKGHDVSKLLQSLDGDSVSQALSGQDLLGTSVISLSSESQTQRVAPPSATSPRRDTAVQTEIGYQYENGSLGNTDKPSPKAEETCIAPPNCGNGKKSCHGEVKASEKIHNKEHVYTAFKEADSYELYARSSGSHKLEKRPEWNIQRPPKAFVPASERYPEALQRHRQESRRQRQMELMTLVERNTRTAQQDQLPHAVNNHRPHAQRHRRSPQPQSANQLEEPSAISAERRLMASPVPSVKNRVPSHLMTAETECPPLLDYVPYVRTDEVYHMDPLAPLSRPSTHEVRQRADTMVSNMPASPAVQHDLVPPKSTERQQAILKGLSELRHGLLQRQKELETSLNPVLQTQQRNYFSPFRPV